MTKYSIVIWLGLLVAARSQAQLPATVECFTGGKAGHTVYLYKVEDGKKVSIASATVGKNGYYGFKRIPEYEGFYAVGDARSSWYPVYLKPGITVSLYMDQDTVYLTGKKK